LSRNVYIELATDDRGNVVKTVKLQHAGVSLINFGSLDEVDWNESFDRLADYLESEMNWSNYLNEYN